jgi:hypothetical protein
MDGELCDTGVLGAIHLHATFSEVVAGLGPRLGFGPPPRRAKAAARLDLDVSAGWASITSLTAWWAADHSAELLSSKVRVRGRAAGHQGIASRNTHRFQ